MGIKNLEKAKGLLETKFNKLEIEAMAYMRRELRGVDSFTLGLDFRKGTAHYEDIGLSKVAMLTIKKAFELHKIILAIAQVIENKLDIGNLVKLKEAFASVENESVGRHRSVLFKFGTTDTKQLLEEAEALCFEGEMGFDVRLV